MIGGLVLLLAAVGDGGAWGWLDARTLGGIVGGLAALTVRVAVEQRLADPFVDLSLVVRPGLGLPLLAGLLIGAELFGSQAAGALLLGMSTSTGLGLGLGLVLAALSMAT